MIGLINYGAGNLRSVINALRWVEAPMQLIERPEQMKDVGGLILPGVGAFIPAMQKLNEAEFTGPLQRWAGEEGRPLLGVCLGMQLLAAKGTEGGDCEGLGLVDAVIERLVPAEGVRVPHMGWNSVEKVRDARLWEGMDSADCYFVHGYHMAIKDPDEHARATIGITDHGMPVVAMVECENVMGTQFHPEKSQKDGLAILKNFVEFARKW